MNGIDYDRFPEPEADIRSAVGELESKTNLDAFQAEQELAQLLEYSVSLDEAKESVLDQSIRTDKVESYDRFVDWNADTRPPKIDSDDWVELEDTDGRMELREIGRQLAKGYDSVVYCIECELYAQSIRSLERRSKELFGECIEFATELYTSDRIFYIGQTTDLPRRLQTHGTGTMSEYHPPSRVTRLCELKNVGVAFRSQSPDQGEQLEELYGENFKGIVDEDIFVYYA
ncbi:hypothetical protein [Halosolutus gelatinilyticus]|uniref:hypothetical protein n=1 Tax=Halosolutus gelatinilyticus TaxID=2931975 RepID=UPI001FF520EF|nr:hypothetical protein [Halosolutus gelatinilyticus]